MHVLGLDTSTNMGSVGLVSEERFIGEYTLNVARAHSERVMAVVSQVLEDAHLSPEELSGIAVTLGPGSFTGLRIGVVTAKGLAYALGKPIVGVSTLKAIAENFRYFQGLICPLLDARRGQVYGGLYRYVAEKEELEELFDDSAIDLIAFLEKVGSYTEPVIFCGEGAFRFKSIIREKLGSKALFPSNAATAIRGGLVAELGLKAIQKGSHLDNVFDLKPLYLRRSEAELLQGRTQERTTC